PPQRRRQPLQKEQANKERCADKTRNSGGDIDNGAPIATLVSITGQTVLTILNTIAFLVPTSFPSRIRRHGRVTHNFFRKLTTA
ncbi:MAG: hypothetical protein MR855_04730, partial [Collinsella sp.]|nr:hypothetical protein [Collinsella sp.]